MIAEAYVNKYSWIYRRVRNCFRPTVQEPTIIPSIHKDELWFVRIKNADQVSKVKILEVTAHTVQLKVMLDTPGDFYTLPQRYETNALTWIEKVNAK